MDRACSLHLVRDVKVVGISQETGPLDSRVEAELGEGILVAAVATPGTSAHVLTHLLLRQA